SKFRTFRVLADEYFRDIPEERRTLVSAEINRELTELLNVRRDKPEDDLVSKLLDVRLASRHLTDHELLSICFLLFLAGLDTVVNVLTFSYRTLAGLPAIQRRLAADPSLIPPFVEETLRLHGVTMIPRMVVKDTERFGVRFRAGEMILVLNSLFGRDERENNDSKSVNIDRQHRAMLPFSTGTHLCLGHILACAEIRILTEAWMKQIPQFRVASGFKPKSRPSLVIAMTSLPLQWS